MKKTIRLTESDLSNIIQKVLQESCGNGYGLSKEKKREIRNNENPLRHFAHKENRGKKKVKGDMSSYNKYIKGETEKGNFPSKRLKKGGEKEWTDKFLKHQGIEEAITRAIMKKTVRLTESELKKMIHQIIKETRLDYDIDNFSGRWTKNPPEDYIDPEGYLDNPNTGDPFGEFRDEIVNDYNGDEKAAENDYSWDMFDNKGIAPAPDGIGTVTRKGIERDKNDIMNRRNFNTSWTDRQLKSADRMKDKWIKGERDLDDVDDAFYGSSLNEAITRAIRKVLK